MIYYNGGRRRFTFLSRWNHYVGSIGVTVLIAVCFAFVALISFLLVTSSQFNHDQRRNVGSAVFLLIVIPSAPENRDQRDFIRSTWLNTASPNDDSFIHLFAVGGAQIRREVAKELRVESRKHGDIMILDDVLDSYQTLNVKMLMTFVVVSSMTKLVPRFRFLLKTDSDSFVNIPALLERLKQPDVVNEEFVHLGYFLGDDVVQLTGKLADPTWNLCHRYLPYTPGGGYVLSSPVVDYIASNAAHLRLFANEDVNVGFWLAPLNIIRIHERRFNTETLSRGCRNNYIVSHPHKDDDELALMYRRYVTSQGRAICERENMQRLAHEYNWTAKLAECCRRELEFCAFCYVSWVLLLIKHLILFSGIYFGVFSFNKPEKMFTHFVLLFLFLSPVVCLLIALSS